MKFTLSWLNDHLATKATLDDILGLMLKAGLEVEEVEDPREKLAAFTVCKVKAAEPHPDADKLRVCTVDTVDGEKQIVCGAPNARAGMTAIYAPLGTFIPGLDFALDKKPRKIRGIESYGMMCSTKELEAGEDHDGIADLDESIALGTPAADALGLNDPVIDFEVTPNRPDWLGVQGIARDLAAAGAGRFLRTELKKVVGTKPCPVEIQLDAPEACPVFAGAVIVGVKNGPSPDWMQQRLKAVGIQPKSLLVDVTNYISLDRARPLHAYDAAKLSGPVVARLGRKGEKLAALDGKTYDISEEMCVIADDSGAIGLGGVMGGESTAVSDETVDVFIESAWFDPLRTARTGRATGIHSDARYRFERGVDPHSCMDGLNLAIALIVEYGGGVVSKPNLAGEAPVNTKKVTFYPADVERLTGLSVKPADMRRMLKDLEFGIEDAGDAWYLTPPTFRFDMEQSADIVEEVARLVGFDQLPTTSLPAPEGGVKAITTPMQARVRAARRVMASRGFLEAVSWSFMARDDAALFGKTSDALVRPFNERHWQGTPAAYDSYAAKADLFAVLDALGQPGDRFQVAAPAQPHWHPGQAASLKLGPKVTVAHFGQLHPGVLKALDVDGPVYGFELNLNALPQMKAKNTKTKPVFERAELTPIRRDLAFVVDRAVPASDLVRHAQGADKKLITRVDVFDVYEGTGVPEGQKSVAFEMTLQPQEKLKDEDIQALMDKVVASVAKGTGGVLRG